MKNIKAITGMLELLEDGKSDMLSGGFVLVSTTSSTFGGKDKNMNCSGCSNNCAAGNCYPGCGVKPPIGPR